MLKKLILLAFAFSILIFCNNGEKSTENVSGPAVKVKKTEAKENVNSEEKSEVPEIGEIKFTSPVNESNDLILSVTTKDPQAEANFNYRWFVNDQEIKGENLNLLSKDFFKKGDWVYCRVTAEENGITSSEKRSRLVKIGGAFPIIENTPPPEFSVPGLFRYTIKASVPDTLEEQLEPDFGEEENPAPRSKLIFDLISPTGSGIILNKKTGEITWNITKDILEKFGSSVEIKFMVTYPEGGSVNSSIILNLKPQEGEEEGIQPEASGREVD